MGYAVIPLGAEKASNFNKNFRNVVSSSVVPPDFATDYGVLTGYIIDPYVLEIYEFDSSPSARYFSIHIDISKSIPVGAKIIDAKISIFNPSSTTLDTGGADNNFSLFLSAGLDHIQSIDVKTRQSSGFSDVMIGYTAQSQLIINSGNEPSLRTNYQTLEIPTLNFTGTGGVPGSGTGPISNTDISGHFASGNGYGLSANLVLFYHPSGAPGSIPILIASPLIVTYVF